MELNHLDGKGNAIMVDVSGKSVTARTAVASGLIHVSPEVINAIAGGSNKKGDVLAVARVAGIMAAKRTAELIPLCHPLPMNKCAVDFETDESGGTIKALCTVSTEAKTGVEMEALTGASLALLTIYDMCKAIDKHMRIDELHLVSKRGGASDIQSEGGKDEN